MTEPVSRSVLAAIQKNPWGGEEHVGGVVLAQELQLLFIASANAGTASLMIMAVGYYIFINHVGS